MAKNNGGRKVTAVKFEEEKESGGIMPYIVSGIAGVGVGLLAALLFKDTVREPQPSACYTGSCESNGCPVCLDEAIPSYRTHCCKRLIHASCVAELRKHKHSKCPTCRSPNWLG